MLSYFFFVGVERFIKLNIYNSSTKTLSLLEERQIYHTNNTWLTFNATHPVNLLLQQPDKKKKVLEFVVSVESFLSVLTYNSDAFKLSLLPVTEDIEHDYPILIMFYSSLKRKGLKNVTKANVSESEAQRVKRNIEDDYEEETNRVWDNEVLGRVEKKKHKRLRNTCKRKPLYVDFTEIHYDSWIVQPSGYEVSPGKFKKKLRLFFNKSQYPRGSFNR